MDPVDSQLLVKRNAPMSADAGAGLIVAGVLAILVYTTWVWGGIRPSFHRVGVWAAGLLFIGMGLWRGGPAKRRMWRDPVFYLGLLFLLYLGVQWLNAGRISYFDVGYQRWQFLPPRWPNWPWAFARSEAAQMLAWFFPAWVLVLAIRLMDAPQLNLLLLGLVGQAGLLALFGVGQFVSGTSAIFWHTPVDGRFFASFAYAGHAAPYFVLTGGLASGLLLDELFHRSSVGQPRATPHVRRPGRIVLLSALTVLCLAGANLALSRIGIIFAWTLAIFTAGYGARVGWPRLTPVGRFHLLLLIVALVTILYYAVAGLGAEQITQELALKPQRDSPLAPRVSRLELELGGRPQLIQAGWRVWQNNFWLGVGGWGFKYLVADELSGDVARTLRRKGWANVHCDPIQFFGEFGIVGALFGGGALGMLVWSLFPRPTPFRPLWTLGLVSLSTMALISCMDLPFRCPAILYTWAAILAALPRVCREQPTEPMPAVGTVASADPSDSTVAAPGSSAAAWKGLEV